MKKIFILSLLVIVGVLAVSQVVLADSAMISAIPAASSITVGTSFNVSVQLNPANNKVCVVKGTINLDKLTCQSITLASGVMGQTTPTCEAPSFTIGIPKCTAVPQNLFTVSVKGTQAGQASLTFSGVKVIGAGTDVPFGSQSGIYEIITSAVKVITNPEPTPVQKIITKTATVIQPVKQATNTATTTSIEQAAQENNISANTGAVLAVITSGYAWSLLIIIVILCLIYGIYYLTKKNKKE